MRIQEKVASLRRSSTERRSACVTKLSRLQATRCLEHLPAPSLTFYSFKHMPLRIAKSPNGSQYTRGMYTATATSTKGQNITMRVCGGCATGCGGGVKDVDLLKQGLSHDDLDCTQQSSTSTTGRKVMYKCGPVRAKGCGKRREDRGRGRVSALLELHQEKTSTHTRSRLERELGLHIVSQDTPSRQSKVTVHVSELQACEKTVSGPGPEQLASRRTHPANSSLWPVLHPRALAIQQVEKVTLLLDTCNGCLRVGLPDVVVAVGREC